MVKWLKWWTWIKDDEFRRKNLSINMTIYIHMYVNVMWNWFSTNNFLQEQAKTVGEEPELQTGWLSTCCSFSFPVLSIFSPLFCMRSFRLGFFSTAVQNLMFSPFSIPHYQAEVKLLMFVSSFHSFVLERFSPSALPHVLCHFPKLTSCLFFIMYKFNIHSSPSPSSQQLSPLIPFTLPSLPQEKNTVFCFVWVSSSFLWSKFKH